MDVKWLPYNDLHSLYVQHISLVSDMHVENCILLG